MGLSRERKLRPAVDSTDTCTIFGVNVTDPRYGWLWYLIWTSKIPFGSVAKARPPKYCPSKTKVSSTIYELAHQHPGIKCNISVSGIKGCQAQGFPPLKESCLQLGQDRPRPNSPSTHSRQEALQEINSFGLESSRGLPSLILPSFCIFFFLFSAF